MTKGDIELAFVREFQCSGIYLGAALSSAERHERVRVSIYRANRQSQQFYDQPFNYADAFRIWSGKNIEQRRTPRVPLTEPEIENSDE